MELYTIVLDLTTNMKEREQLSELQVACKASFLDLISLNWRWIPNLSILSILVPSLDSFLRSPLPVLQSIPVLSFSSIAIFRV